MLCTHKTTKGALSLVEREDHYALALEGAWEPFPLAAARGHYVRIGIGDCPSLKLKGAHLKTITLILWACRLQHPHLVKFIVLFYFNFLCKMKPLKRNKLVFVYWHFEDKIFTLSSFLITSVDFSFFSPYYYWYIEQNRYCFLLALPAGNRGLLTWTTNR